MRDFQKLSFQDACEVLGKPIEPSQTDQTETKPILKKESPVKNQNLWNRHAVAFLKWTQNQLKSNPSILDWLNAERGLIPETILNRGLGYNPTDFYRDLASWGLLPEQKENGKPKQLWLPCGLVIPYTENGKLLRIRIRRFEGETRY